MLQKQSVDLIFSGGPDRKSDSFTVIPTKLTSLQNGRFVDHTTLIPRGGFKDLVGGNSVYSGSAPSAFRRMVSRGEEVGVENYHGFHAADVTGVKWRQIASTLNRCCAELDSIAHPMGDVLECDMAAQAADGLQVIVWTDLSFGGGFVPNVFAQVRRGNTVLAQQNLTTNSNYHACCPRVIYSSISTKFYIYWVENQSGTGKLVCATISAASPASIGAGTVIENTYMLASTTGATSGVPMIAYMDVIHNSFTTNGNIYLAHRSVTGGSVGGVRHLKLSLSNGTTIVASDATSVGALGGANVTGVSVCVGPEVGGGGGTANYNAIVSTATAANGVTQLFANDTFGFAAGANGGTPTGRVTCILEPNAQGSAWFAWDEGTAGSTTSKVVVATAALNGGAFTTGPTTVARSIGLAASFLSVNSDLSLYLGVSLFSTVQPTFYMIEAVTNGAVVTSQQDICCRIDLLNAPIANRYQLRGVPRFAAGPALPLLRSSQDFVTIATAVPVNNVNDTNRTPIGLDLLTLDFSAQLNSVQVDRSVVLAGADPQIFDGNSIVELGFENFPESPSLSVGGAGGATSTGTYFVTCLFEWIDRYGIVHQSAPAVPVSAAVTAGQKITVTVPTLRITKKTGVRIVVYRSAANGTTLYRVMNDTTYSNAVLNVTDADSITLAADGLSDAVVQTGEFLPTTGGALANEAFPACKHIAPHQDRLVFSGLVDRELVQYTEERQGVFFPGTNGVYLLEVNTEAGRCSGTISMDDKLIIAQEGALGVFMGRGPNRLGLDNQMSNYIRVENSYGHSWAESSCLVQDTDGIWFRDQRGLRQLNRALQITQMQTAPDRVLPLGSEVDELVSTLAGAAVIDSKKQVVFANTSNFLVWDYEHKQWSKYVSSYGYSYQDPVELSGQLTFVSTDTSQLLAEVTSQYTDASSQAIIWTWETAWIKLTGLQGFQRAYRATVLGKYLGGRATSDFTVNGAYPVTNVSTIHVNEATSLGIAVGDLAFISGTYYTVTAVDDFSNADHQNITIDGAVTVANGDPLPVYTAVSTTTLEAAYDFDESYGSTAVTFRYVPRSTTEPMQFQHHLLKQKCEAIRFRLGHRPIAGPTRFTGMTIQLGGKGGMFKIESRKRV